MSEPDGIDEVVDGSLRQSLMAASRLAETLARMRQESLRQREQQDTQNAHEAQAREAAQRAAVQGALAPVQKGQWCEQAQPKDIAQVHALADGWKNHDPTALAAAERPSRDRTSGPTLFSTANTRSSILELLRPCSTTEGSWGGNLTRPPSCKPFKRRGH